MTPQILIVEDEPVQRRLLKNAVERHGYEAHVAENGREGLALAKKLSDELDVVVLDLMMPEMGGFEFIDALNETGIDIPVIVQTGQGGIDTVVQAMRAGAFDFVVKPVSPERLGSSIANALKLDGKNIRARSSRRKNTDSVRFDDIISASPAMARVMDLSRRAALSNIPVVVEGESGVGKEMVAKAIHSGSERASKPFVTVNCGAIPPNMVESVLFGHEKGAFPGADEKHLGKFAEADGGTLFLDEIGDLPLEVQVKLLRAIQQGEIETVGARQPRRVNVRLISATNKDLIEEVKSGRFREDLYYRLNVYPIHIPALRKRKEDVPVLVRAFVERFSREQKLATPLNVPPRTMALLTAFDWPGNIRQLENAIFRAAVLGAGPELNIDDFPQIAPQVPGYTIRQDGHINWSGVEKSDTTRDMPKVYPDFSSQSRLQLTTEPPARLHLEAIPSLDDAGDVRRLADVEEELIRFALKFYHGQMSQVARKLGIGRSTLYRKLKEYNIDPEHPLAEAS
ncbi:sigma-54 dependent transcriptional regulator [Rhizobium sp. L1K21]|uniref:sigma-54-dependent transcriptional regulator n=1 Tax=Rhizobium sp. L1K21 TaxID=2954933 RepID=UPI0020938873|nr:sigma-54 dependent transcriptional regulator [Rhizobium sp. L1K21]MCO6185041.1 sigma-54 dependent transcriptional regulator [Rhizobium sp. L1K21]